MLGAVEIAMQGVEGLAERHGGVDLIRLANKFCGGGDGLVNRGRSEGASGG